jgi:hypothetical protein
MSQILMHACVVYYNKPMFFTIFNQRTRLKKGLVFNFKSNCIIALRKHVNVNHGSIAKHLKK